MDGLPPEQTRNVSRPSLLGGQASSLQHKGVPGLATAEPDLKPQVALPTALSEAQVCHLCGQERGLVRNWGRRGQGAREGSGGTTLKERL